MKKYLPVCFLAIVLVFSVNSVYAADAVDAVKAVGAVKAVDAVKTVDAVKAANGAALFKKNCGACHGRDLTKKTSMSKPIKGIPVDKVIAAIDGKSEGLNKKYSLMVKTLKKKSFSDEDKQALAEYIQ